MIQKASRIEIGVEDLEGNDSDGREMGASPHINHKKATPDLDQFEQRLP